MKDNNNLIYHESNINSINNNLNNLDNSYNNFENKLNKYINQINKEIRNILNNIENKPSYFNSFYNNLYNTFQRDIISISIDESGILLNEIYRIKNFLENYIQECKKLIKLINPNETNINKKISYFGVNIYNKGKQSQF